MKLLVCGGRNFQRRAYLRAVLDRFLAYESLTIITGCASGADAHARQWAQDTSTPLIVETADWDAHGRSAGPRRNQRMIEHKPDLVLAFTGGAGTADMVRRAREAGVTVEEHL